MIDEILESLTQLGELSDISSTSIAASFGGTINIDIRGKNDEHLYVKVSQDFDVTKEYQRISGLPDSLDQWICRPIALITVAGRNALVFPGISHRPIHKDRLFNRAGFERNAILEFFSVFSKELSSQDNTQLNHELLRTREAIDSEPQLAILGKWSVDLDAGWLCELSGISQHGDFAINNLGWTGNGLHVFDWEEFSSSRVPGYDLTAFLLSILDFDPTRIALIIKSAEGDAGILARDACEAIGLSWPQYRELFPIHLATLWVLRRRYLLAKTHMDRLMNDLQKLA